MVTSEVASRLDESELHGVWWFNRRKTRTQQVSERGPNGIVYRRKMFTSKNPPEDWIAVLVPYSGIPREWIDAARDAIKDNRPTSSAGQREWTLSGGLFVCGVCGRSMTAMTTGRPNGRRYFYYRCPRRAQDGNGACSQAKCYVAEEVESGMWGLVLGVLTDPELLRADLERLIEQERRSMRGDPEREAEAWLEKLSEADRKRDGYIDLAAEGIMSRAELGAKLARIEEARRNAETELQVLRGRQEKLEELRRDKDALLEHYAALAPEALDSLTPEERRQLYRMLWLRAVARLDGSVELTGDLVGSADVSGPKTTRPSCASRRRRILLAARSSPAGPGNSTSRSRLFGRRPARSGRKRRP